VELNDLIKLGENQTQDFKHAIDDQRKIARTLVAFANTDGGSLLIGVKDNGKINGINPEEEFHMIEGAAKLYCQPEINFESKVWKVEHKMVLEIKISSSESKEFKAVNEENEFKAYFRYKDNTYLANKIVLKTWKHKREGVKRPLKFGIEEQLFLKLVQTKEEFTLSQLYKQLDFTKQKIDNLLAMFIHWQIITFEINTNGFVYKIR
jgi:predicted HTH transcriptional regulator